MNKRYSIVLLMMLLICAMSSCDTQKQKEAAVLAAESKEDSLELVIKQLRHETDDLNGLKLRLNDMMRQINEAEDRVMQVSPETSGQQIIVENMAFIQQKMNEYRRVVAEMKQQLRNAEQISDKAKRGYEADIAAFTNLLKKKNEEIDSLRIAIAEKELVIAEQGSVILKQGEAVNDLVEQNAEKEKILMEQDRKLHTAWYVFGTKKELQKNNILEKDHVMRSEDVNHDYFTEIDIRVTKNIALHSKKVKVLSNHPSGSYTLEKDTKGLFTLRITDVESFWSTTRYLVVSVK